MLKRLFAILSVVLGTIIFLSGCSKDNHNTLAFIGDESEMKSCYEIYPQQYFPSEISDLLREGRFPPDIVGEYEMNGECIEWTLAYYWGNSYVLMPIMNPISIYLIIDEQVNGMAKLKLAFKKSGAYDNWFDVDAYIYGDVFAVNNSNDFIICSEYKDNNGEYIYNKGIIIKGTINNDGISNIHFWPIIKDRTPKEDKPRIFNYYGWAHYHADFAERKSK